MPWERGCQETSCIEANCLRVSKSDLSLAGLFLLHFLVLPGHRLDYENLNDGKEEKESRGSS